jgi:uncharacterized protein (DUF1501 family)
MTPPSMDRRDFLRLSALAGASAGVAAGRSAWSNPADDYRALVCVFLYGGMDSFNLIVPTDPFHYAEYSAARGVLAEPLGSLLPVASGGLGFHPSTGALRDLYDTGRLAGVANVGPLVAPTVKAEVEAGTKPLPINLQSHIDQQREWMRAWSGVGVGQGWVGRMLDQLGPVNGATPIPAGIAVATSDLVMTGAQTAPYVIGANGLKKLPGILDPKRRALIEELGGLAQHPLGGAFAQTQQQAIDIYELLVDAVDGAPDLSGLFPDTPIGSQLEMVARLISVRAALGMSRQVFFVSHGSYDTHDLQLEVLPQLLSDLAPALGAFQTAIEQLGEGPNVVTFSHSDFGRTMTSNGKGSDHGWGGNAVVIGQPVAGGQLYGSLPSYTVGGSDVLDAGHVVPTLAVEQLTATLARWFGLSPAELDLIFPNLANFAPGTLGFLP